jgi:hypothetical protein
MGDRRDCDLVVARGVGSPGYKQLNTTEEPKSRGIDDYGQGTCGRRGRPAFVVPNPPSP